MHGLKRISESGRDTALFVALLGLACLLLARYLGAERTYYYWDHALYPAWSLSLFAAFQADTVAAWTQLRSSLNDDYSRIYTLPEMAAFALFGANRLTYMLANFVVYGGGLALAVGGIAAQLTGWRFGLAARLALLALLLAPFVWIPLVDAYPDLGGTALLAAALVLLLRRWPHVQWRIWVAVGALLALTILFRRHFIYPAAALLAAAGIVQFCWRVRCEPLRQVVLAGLGGVVAAAVCAGLLYLAAPEFVLRLLIMNYPQLYASYAEDAAGLLDRQSMVVGTLTLCSALAGYALAWRRCPEIRASLALLLLLGLLWGVMWFGFVRFGGKHYLLQVLPIIVAVGWLLLGRALWTGTPLRRLLGGVLAFVLVLQAALCFWFGDVLHSSPGRQPLPGIFALARPPLVRDDAPVLRELVDYLHATSGGDDRIAVIASSPLFNQDLLSAVDRARAAEFGLDNARLPIVAMPEIDRRDPLPLDAIAQATILLVVIPPQYHLKPAGQQVVGSVLALLTAKTEFAQAWQKDDRHFMLDHGVTVDVVRLRQARTPAAMATMLQMLRDRAEPSGSLAQDWVLTRADFNGRLATDAQNRTTIFGRALPSPEAKPFTAFFMVPLVAHAYRVVGTLAAPASCSIAAMLSFLGGDGKEVESRAVTPQANGTFMVDVPAATTTTYLQLSVQATANKIASCPFSIEGLQVLGR